MSCGLRFLYVFFQKPDTARWLKVAEGFSRNWQFANCVGAVDGKHVHIRAPGKSGSMYFNYKVGSASMLFNSQHNRDWNIMSFHYHMHKCYVCDLWFLSECSIHFTLPGISLYVGDIACEINTVEPFHSKNMHIAKTDRSTNYKSIHAI